jgi:hypothetical protein
MNPLRFFYQSTKAARTASRFEDRAAPLRTRDWVYCCYNPTFTRETRPKSALH